MWNPLWVAWMVDGVVYRNSSVYFQGQNTVPWRPLSLRPTLHTTTGVAPTITGTYTGPSLAGLATGALVVVPAGSVTLNGVVQFTNTLTSVTVTNPPLTAGFQTVAPTVVASGVALSNPTLNLLPDSFLYIRRIRYTPCASPLCNEGPGDSVIAAAVQQPSSWAQQQPQVVTAVAADASGGSFFTRNGAPFFVKGATINDTVATQLNLNRLANLGVNAVRIYAPSVTMIATAALNNVTVLVGLPLPPLATTDANFYQSPLTTVPLMQNALAAVRAVLAGNNNAVLAWCDTIPSPTTPQLLNYSVQTARLPISQIVLTGLSLPPTAPPPPTG